MRGSCEESHQCGKLHYQTTYNQYSRLDWFAHVLEEVVEEAGRDVSAVLAVAVFVRDEVEARVALRRRTREVDRVCDGRAQDAATNRRA